MGSRQTAGPWSAAVAAAFLLAACGDGQGALGDRSSAPLDTEVSAGLIDFEIRLSQPELPGTTVTLTVTNAGGTGHDLHVVTDDDHTLAATRVLQPGEQERITADLTGMSTVTLVCKFAGHDLMGMSIEVPVVDAGTSTATVLQEANAA